MNFPKELGIHTWKFRHRFAWIHVTCQRWHIMPVISGMASMGMYRVCRNLSWFFLPHSFIPRGKENLEHRLIRPIAYFHPAIHLSQSRIKISYNEIVWIRTIKSSRFANGQSYKSEAKHNTPLRRGGLAGIRTIWSKISSLPFSFYFALLPIDIGGLDKSFHPLPRSRGVVLSLPFELYR